MKQQNKYELIGDIWYCNGYGIYAKIKDLSEPGFEPWVRFRVKITTIANLVLGGSRVEDFIYHGDRGILGRLISQSEAGDPPYEISKVKINKKLYRLLLKQVHEKTPQLKKNKYLLGWPGNIITPGLFGKI